MGLLVFQPYYITTYHKTRYSMYINIVASPVMTVAIRILLLIIALTGPSLVAARLPFIVGGKDADPGEWPWQASLQYKNKHNCGASLISGRWVYVRVHTQTRLKLLFSAQSAFAMHIQL